MRYKILLIHFIVLVYSRFEVSCSILLYIYTNSFDLIEIIIFTLKKQIIRFELLQKSIIIRYLKKKSFYFSNQEVKNQQDYVSFERSRIALSRNLISLTKVGRDRDRIYFKRLAKRQFHRCCAIVKSILSAI